MQIRRAVAADEEALARIRRRAILALAVPVLSRAQAETWATRATVDRIARAISAHDVWVALEEAAIGWVEVNRDRVAALYVSPSVLPPRGRLGPAYPRRNLHTSLRLRDGAARGQPERARLLPPEGLPAMWPARCQWCVSVAQRSGRS